MTENSGYAGQMKVSDAAGAFNAQAFVINQLIGRINTSTVVKVVKCTNDGGLSPVGFVDVEPMVNQVDGQGNPIPHGTIYGLPYMRIQGGVNAIVIDPEVGDIGVAVFASRDISKIKANKDKALPGSLRKYSMADGVYIGGLLNAVPQQYIQFESTGITIVSPQKVTVNAPSIEANCDSAVVNTETAEINASTSFEVTSPANTINGPLTVTGPITGNSGASLGGDLAVTGKINATAAIESATSLKVGGVTLNVP